MNKGKRVMFQRLYEVVLVDDVSDDDAEQIARDMYLNGDASFIRGPLEFCGIESIEVDENGDER